MGKGDIIISTVLLNWNRIECLSRTVNSYLRTVDTDYELIIVDNNSMDRSKDFIRSICADKPNHHAILLDKNIGGAALNIGADKTIGKYIHFSENDIEYLPGWRKEMISKFDVFPELGQLSPFAPFPQKELGEIFGDKSQDVQPLIKEGRTIYVTSTNCGTTSIIRREIWDKGIRWKSYGKGNIWFPDDGSFSREIRNMGYIVAYSDKYLVINWGHNIKEFLRDTSYYVRNYESKTWFGIEGFKERLKEHGYLLLPLGNDMGYKIVADKSRNNIFWKIARNYSAEFNKLLPLGTKRRVIAQRVFYWLIEKTNNKQLQ